MLTVLNDTHIGAIRAAGTTPSTQWQLRHRTLEKFKNLLPEEGDLMLLGDLFDTFNVPIHDVLQTYRILDKWLVTHPDSKCYNVAGNHDLSKVSTNMSSFNFLGQLYKDFRPTQYVHIEAPTMTPWGYVIPHLANQDLFDAALAEVPETKFLFLHCNYDNHFAAQSDHSLNLSVEAADKLKVQTIVLAHEHHTRRSGKVVVPGNQIATSVADWLSPSDKSCVVISDNQELSLKAVALREAEYIEIPWTDLVLTNHPFVRVVGNATAEQGREVVSLLSKYRQKSESLVVTNAVKFLSAEGVELDVSSIESLESFDIWNLLKELMSAEDYTILKGLANA